MSVRERDKTQACGSVAKNAHATNAHPQFDHINGSVGRYIKRKDLFIYITGDLLANYFMTMLRFDSSVHFSGGLVEYKLE